MKTKTLDQKIYWANEVRPSICVLRFRELAIIKESFEPVFNHYMHPCKHCLVIVNAIGQTNKTTELQWKQGEKNSSVPEKQITNSAIKYINLF